MYTFQFAVKLIVNYNRQGFEEEVNQLLGCHHYGKVKNSFR